MKYTNIIVKIDRLLNKYSYEVINNALLKYNKRVIGRSACGELGNITEPTIKMSNISHLVESLTLKHNQIYIDILTIDKRPGNRLKDILHYGHKHKFQVRTIELEDSFDIISIDVVDNSRYDTLTMKYENDNIKINWIDPNPKRSP